MKRSTEKQLISIGKNVFKMFLPSHLSFSLEPQCKEHTTGVSGNMEGVDLKISFIDWFSWKLGGIVFLSQNVWP